MTTLERIHFAPNKERLQPLIADFKDRTGHYPTNGQLPAFYVFGFNSERQYLNALNTHFLLEMFPDKPVRLLFFTNS